MCQRAGPRHCAGLRRFPSPRAAGASTSAGNARRRRAGRAKPAQPTHQLALGARARGAGRPPRATGARGQAAAESASESAQVPRTLARPQWHGPSATRSSRLPPRLLGSSHTAGTGQWQPGS
jgi:hypothetical protein